MLKRILSICLMAAVAQIVASSSHAQDDVLVDIKRLRPQELEFAGFELARSQTVTIDAIGIRHRRSSSGWSSAWILDASTREVVWEMEDARSKKHSDKLREFHDTLELQKGKYEVYYGAWFGHGWNGFSGMRDVFDKVKDVFSDDDYDDHDDRDFKRAAKKFKIEVRGEGTRLFESDLVDYHEQLTKNAIVAYTQLDGDRFEKHGLTVKKPTKLNIYMVGEVNKDGEYDHCWIINTETREKAWGTSYRQSEHAGGGDKNRMVKDTFTLPAGSYGVFVASDGSHHFDEWNAAPPYDPFFWGVTISAADPNQRGNLVLGDYEEEDDKHVVLQFAPLGDREFRSEGFTLKKRKKLRIYAIGESGGDELADYSWIANADTRETVWKMTYDKSEHAGGASKNRQVEEVIELPAGNYLAFAVTDGSHSIDHFNRAAPYDRDHWGLSVYAADGRTGDVARYVEQEDKNVLASITRAGNNEFERERFSLGKRASVRVYAIGEGKNGKMYDYAWIENADTKKVVWEMTYRNTEHAGGGKKNRAFNDTITLDAGEYILYYESDGSHSYDEWNTSPPFDSHNWGVTVKLGG